MKRTLTAAAAVLVAGGAGVGMAATASAAGDPQLPASLPTDNGVANTVFHAAGTLASAQKTVGGVIPLDQQLSGRSSDPVTGALGSTPVGGALKPVVDGVGKATSGQTSGVDPVSTLGQATPVGQTLSKSDASDVTAPLTNTLGQLPVDGQLPLANTSTVNGAVPKSLTGTLENQQPVASTQDSSGSLPATDLVGDTATKVVGNAGTSVPLGRSGDPVGGLLGGGSSPLSGVTNGLPVGKSGSPVDQVTNLASHGPLSGINQLGG